MCFEIRPLSSQTKDTITIVGSNGTSWNQEPSSDVAGDGGATSESRSSTTHVACSVTTVSQLPQSWLPTKQRCLRLLLQRVSVGVALMVGIMSCVASYSRERERERESDREEAARGWGRDQVKEGAILELEPELLLEKMEELRIGPSGGRKH